MNIELEKQFKEVFGDFPQSDLYQKGRDDCFKGIPARLDDQDYLDGYQTEYALEQITGGLDDE